MGITYSPSGLYTIAELLRVLKYGWFQPMSSKVSAALLEKSEARRRTGLFWEHTLEKFSQTPLFFLTNGPAKCSSQVLAGLCLLPSRLVQLSLTPLGRVPRHSDP